jgi:hypothetical protein
VYSFSEYHDGLNQLQSYRNVLDLLPLLLVREQLRSYSQSAPPINPDHTT